MYNRRIHIILYGLLFIYASISLAQYFHFKKEIDYRINRIENLNQLIYVNDEKIEELKELNISYNKLEVLLDSTLLRSKSTITKEIIVINNKVYDDIQNLKPKKGEIINKKPSLDTIKREKAAAYLDTFDNNDSIVKNLNTKEKYLQKDKNVSEEPQGKSEKPRGPYFNDITKVYSNIRKPRNVKTKDKYIWLEINSDYGSYEKSIWQIISQVTINGTQVNLNDIKNNISNSPNGFMAIYYIKLKIPKHVIFRERNQIILTADKDYVKWFFVSGK